MFNIFNLLLLVVMLFISAAIYAAEQPLAQRIGLDAENISAMMFDHRGFLWLASQHGLFFYDGNQLYKFGPDINQPGSIAALDIRNLYQSSDNNIWVSTNSGGLSRFNPDDASFSTYRHKSHNANSLSNDSVYDVVDGPDGHLWIATQIGLNRLNRETGEVTRFFSSEADLASLPANYIYKLFVDSRQRLWVGTLGGGLVYWDEQSQNFIRVALPEGVKDVFSIIEQRSEFLWVGTRQGLVKIDLGSMLAHEVELTNVDGAKPIIIALKLYGDTLVVGTHSKGIHFYELKHGKPVHLHSPPEAAGETITSIQSNEQGQLFYSTWGSGIHLLSDFHGDTRKEALNSFWQALPDVTAVYADPEGDKVWIGSFSQGLYQMEMQSPDLHKVENLSSSRQINGIVSISATTDNQLLVGTSSGLWRLSPDGEVLAFIQYQASAANSIGKGFIRVLEPDNSGDIWIGTGGDGLYLYNPASDTFTAFKHNPENPLSLSGNYVTSVLVDNGYLWVGTRSNGLNLCRMANWECERLLVNNTGLSHYYISDIVKDAQGTIWVGTDGGGLHRVVFSDHGQTRPNLVVESGLHAMSIKSIILQPDGSVWFATANGLFSRSDGGAEFYKVRDAMLEDSGSFIQRAKAIANGYTILGTHKGAYFIGNQQPQQPVIPGSLRFTRITHDQQSHAIHAAAISDPFQLEVPWGGMLSLEFALLDFQPASRVYEYRISPAESWTALNNQHHLNFYGLEPGVHHIEVRGMVSGGKWSEPAQLTVSVIPPWWRNSWYQAILLLFIATLAVGYHKYRMAKWQRYTERLNLLKEEKLLAISKLEQNEEKLRAAFEGMRQLATKIQNAKEEERRSISRELHDQFGQSLTAAQISLQLYRRQYHHDTARIDECINSIQLMIKQVRAISFDLRPSLLDDVGLVAGINDQLRKMSASLPSPITFVVDDKFPEVSPGLTTTLFRVIQESVTNAIKHSSATQIKVLLGFSEGIVTADITDNGIGFDREAVKEKAAKGGHLGLLGMEERVLSYDGSLRISALPGRGVTVSVEFPYEE
ncbi:histidine kinase [Shewanella submarina]|uniref:histidine kinase n=1 Tax=Shewanella submarina TaxID=2016376 RepID=A0ABV7GIY5_9GAMM|nr:two-component regulator propeller domain-containing protein [Shewanella submarina]MCL1035821.1 histidine kinase [Shewanella submarina]